MTAEQRTPGPWKVLGGNTIGTSYRPIATIDRGFTGDDKMDAETRANAAFIVMACNAHDDLLAACEALVMFSFSFDTRDQANGAYRGEVRNLQKQAIAAIAKATK